jgi:hypothetical protein
MRRDIIKQAIAGRVGNGTDAILIATSVTSILRSLHEQLDLLIGAQAAGSLCAHALHRTRLTLKWTLPPTTSINGNMLEALREDLASRTPDDCLFAGETLLLALVDHLITLIGRPLTHRLMNSAWNLPGASGQSSQENFND